VLDSSAYGTRSMRRTKVNTYRCPETAKFEYQPPEGCEHPIIAPCAILAGSSMQTADEPEDDKDNQYES
jgi:hypothetical protein